jgi:Holliday junction resolvasome RuvABC endonuclease subunit
VSWFIGLDPSSRSTGIAAMHEDGTLKHVTLHETGELPDRLVRLRAAVRSWLTPYAELGAWCAVVEDPGTRHGGTALGAAYGVCTEAARSVLACPVMTLRSGQWKRLALGNGAAKKPDVMAGARLLGYQFNDQDAADAIVMADCARVLTEDIRRDAA